MFDSRSLTGLGAGVLALLAGQVLAVEDCCSANRTVDSPRVDLIEGTLCHTLWTADVRQEGKFCLPLGAGYANGTTTTLTIGQEFELNASFTIGGDAGGVTVGAATTYSIEQAFEHTAPAGQACQLFASYGGAVLRQWNVQTFYPVVGDSEETRTIFTTFDRSPTIIPCCEPLEGGGGGDWPDPTGNWAWSERPGGAGGVAEGGIFPFATFIVDLRDPSSFFPFGLPGWHPMNAPGSTLATLNGWQKRKIMRQVRAMELFEGYPMSELAVIDVDGTAEFWDLLADPEGIVPCPADTNVDGVPDLTDVTLFINYFTFGDISADLDGSGFIDLGDVSLFVGTFIGGCP